MSIFSGAEAQHSELWQYPTLYVRNVLWRNRHDNLPINPVDFVAGKYKTNVTTF